MCGAYIKLSRTITQIKPSVALSPFSRVSRMSDTPPLPSADAFDFMDELLDIEGKFHALCSIPCVVNSKF
jgi:hypothetical protein